LKIEGPQRYELSITPRSFTVLCEKKTNKFSGLATNKLPKLYIVSVGRKPIYVGMTKRPIRGRLRSGMEVDGRYGYQGYAWRHTHTSATLSVWCHVDAIDRDERDIETGEAEVVFLVRQHLGQWPESQTEIHFHPSRTASKGRDRYIQPISQLKSAHCGFRWFISGSSNSLGSSGKPQAFSIAPSISSWSQSASSPSMRTSVSTLTPLNGPEIVAPL
jgi:hypothetical protein